MAIEHLSISRTIDGQIIFIQVLNSSLVSQFETRWLEFGSMIYDKRIHGVRLEMEEGNPQFQLEVAVAETIDAEVSWIDTGVLFGAKKKDLRIPDGKFFKFRFTDVVLTVSWKITAIEFYGRVLGKRNK